MSDDDDKFLRWINPTTFYLFLIVYLVVTILAS